MRHQDLKQKYKNRKSTLLRIRRLRDPRSAAGYLNKAFSSHDYKIILQALRNVAEAHKRKILRHARWSSANLANLLSDKGKLKITDFIRMMDAIGLTIQIKPSKNEGL